MSLQFGSERMELLAHTALTAHLLSMRAKNRQDFIRRGIRVTQTHKNRLAKPLAAAVSLSVREAAHRE